MGALSMVFYKKTAPHFGTHPFSETTTEKWWFFIHRFLHQLSSLELNCSHSSWFGFTMKKSHVTVNKTVSFDAQLKALLSVWSEKAAKGNVAHTCAAHFQLRSHTYDFTCLINYIQKVTRYTKLVTGYNRHLILNGVNYGELRFLHF